MMFGPFTARENSVEAVHVEMPELWMGGGVPRSLSLPSRPFFLAWHSNYSLDQSKGKEHTFPPKMGLKLKQGNFRRQIKIFQSYKTMEISLSRQDVRSDATLPL